MSWSDRRYNYLLQAMWSHLTSHVRATSGTISHPVKNKSLFSCLGFCYGSQPCQSHSFFLYLILISMQAQKKVASIMNKEEIYLSTVSEWRRHKKATKAQNRKLALLLNCLFLYPRVPYLLNCPCISFFPAPVSAFKPSTSRKRYA